MKTNQQVYNQVHQILLCNEIAEVVLSYRTKVKADERPKIVCSRDIYEILISNWSEDNIEYREEFKLVLLNRANKVLGIVQISEGGKAGTVCDPMMIMQAAILSNASGIIVCHNHPSLSTQPSNADKALTEKIKQCCKLLDVALMDHIIVTKDSFYSFADEGLI